MCVCVCLYIYIYMCVIDAVMCCPETSSGPKSSSSQPLGLLAADLSSVSFEVLTPPTQLQRDLLSRGFAPSQEGLQSFVHAEL